MSERTFSKLFEDREGFVVTLGCLTVPFFRTREELKSQTREGGQPKRLEKARENAVLMGATH